MPNHLIFNGVADQLQAQMNGVDSTGTTRKILTDSSGRLDLGTVTITADNLDIRPLSGTTDSVAIVQTVTVTAENFDIRTLSGTTDSVAVVQLETVTVTAENFDIRALSGTTDSIQLSSRLFTESYIAINGVTNSAAIFIQNTGEESEYTFYVFNTGSNTVTVQLQISPTTTDSYFVDDPSGAVAVTGGNKTTLVASRYLRYTRLFYETSGATCTFEAYYNAHV